MSKRPDYFAVIGNRDHIKLHGEKRPIWEFLDRQPDGWLSSLVYKVKEIPPNNPRMIWDCGAWSYRLKDEPDYTPQECAFLYKEFAAVGHIVIAPDHMIIPGIDKNKRVSINLRNAQQFIDCVSPAFIPMATVHGESIDERIEVARKLHALGYQYLALGGMAVQASRKILAIEIAQSIRRELPEVYLHILGLSSPEYAKHWRNIGINSFDGSSHFKQAFTGGVFFTCDGAKLIKHQALKPGNPDCNGLLPPECNCNACLILRVNGVDTRTYGSNESNMGRAVHNLNMLMKAQQEAMRLTVILVACCKEKYSHPTVASEMYRSELFKKAKEYAQHHADKWFILSAKYGVLDPDTLIKPYDITLNDFTRNELEKWNAIVTQQLQPYRTDKLVVLAGNNYCGWIREFDQSDIERPTKGIGIGEQLKYLKEANDHARSNFLFGFDPSK